MNLEVTLAGKTFKNPVTTASGTFGSGAEYCLLYTSPSPRDTR